MGSKAIEYAFVMDTPFSSQKWDVNAKEESRIKRSLTFQAKAALVVAFLLAVVIVTVIVVIFAIPYSQDEGEWISSFVSPSKLGKFQQAALSTDAAPCAPIGRDILMRNGSAIDAAIAVLVCMGAHNPHSMGLGGGFFMLYYNRSERQAYCLDAREVAPRKSKVDMFKGNATLAAEVCGARGSLLTSIIVAACGLQEDVVFKIIPLRIKKTKTSCTESHAPECYLSYLILTLMLVFLEGGLAIAVPGELAGYWEAYRQFHGRIPWRDLFTPTIEMCRKGIEVSAHLTRAIRLHRDKMLNTPLGEIFLKNGTDIYELGERIQMQALASTLEKIAEQEMKALYGKSELAKMFQKDLENAGSIIDEYDMQSYSPRMREPVQVKLRRNTTLYGFPPPGSGALLAFMMSVLDGYPDMDESAKNSLDEMSLVYHRILETMKFAYAHRSHLEDENSEDMEKLIKKLASREYADEIRSRINDTKVSDDLSFYGDLRIFAEDHGTAHLSLIAPNGDAVAVTSTINQYFGSKVLSPSTGIVLNDEMDDFSSPNITNMFNLPPSEKNHVKPGRRPMSSMTPMILVDSDGNAKLVLGGNGGTTITTGVLQVAVRNFFFGENIKESIDAPRIHHQLTPNVMKYEKSFPEAVLNKLREYGHEIQMWTSGMMSIMMGVHRGDDGLLYSNSDYRKGGDVDGF